jgi:hypothetical protein
MVKEVSRHPLVTSDQVDIELVPTMPQTRTVEAIKKRILK